MRRQVVNGIVLICLVIFIAACTTVREGGYTKNPEKAARVNTDLGIEYIKIGNYSRAKYKLEKALKNDPNLSDAHANYAYLQHILGNAKLAEKHFRKALRLEPNNPDFLNKYGVFLCAEDRLEEAEQRYLEALKDPLYKTPEYAYTNAGECALKVKNYSRAEGYFKKALQRKPNYPNALYNMALVNYQREHYNLADAYLKRYHELDKRNQTAESLYLAVKLAKKLRNNDDRASYSLLLRNNFPDSVQAQRLRADGN